ncbi:ferredoxin [Parabacteroides sp. PFB2-12]|uniref:EFR1 family ferrodoxin n=1 Tax=unclassified Parabacteroides TaxID=2649774 RepID=UPI002476A4FD|nr:MULTISPECIES: EFR1 family ferrodoxin [unclassified Parabacteroides]MDH6343935.1 ferredoxin [Parabacteroides sp. PM6-13]MDH6391704.1 ferredoxin [Parabacteroides sp. PFB2-12]
MIFYFSGTGNSLWVARELAKAFGEPLISISDEQKKEAPLLSYTLRKDEKIIFVYPVHSWGPALLVSAFVSRLQLENYTDQRIYSVSTCGDECGYTGDMLRKELKERRIPLHAAYSIVMPNNYVLMPGFDVDSKEIEQSKLQEAPRQIRKIVEAINKANPSDALLYKQGSLPFVKSRLIYPLFKRFAVKQNEFYATDNCISCGICEQVCPTSTITIGDSGRPQWAKESCVQCVACIHYCPERAIEYGKVSLKKGRYHHPDIKAKAISS